MEPYEILKEDSQSRDGDGAQDDSFDQIRDTTNTSNIQGHQFFSKEFEPHPAITDAPTSFVKLLDGHPVLEGEKEANKSPGSLLFDQKNSNMIYDVESDEECDGKDTQFLSGKGNKDVKNVHSFVFLPKSAIEFGFGASNSDTPLIDGQELSRASPSFNGISENSPLNEGNESIASLEEDSSLFEKENQAFIRESGRSGNRKSRSEKSDSFSDQPTSGKESSSSKKNQGVKDREKVPLLLPSPARTDVSSEEDSTLMSTSLELDSLRSPGVASDGEDEDQGVCSKYSQLSEDGSSPSSNFKADADARKDRIVFEHSLELCVAFSEYVDVDDFKASLGERNPHTEDAFGGKSEEHLLVLLKAGLSNLKTYLRQCQWPAESDTRHKLWENICTHLLKAKGNLYEDLVKDCYGKASGDEDVSLPAFVDPLHLHHHHLTLDGIAAVRRIMGVIGHFDPDVLHCPLLYPLASAFLHYMGPGSCFNCMQALLRSNEPSYIFQTRSANQAAIFVLRDLAKKYTKQAYALIVRSSKNPDSVFENWIFWLFQDLPFQYLVRIIDCFLIEGYKVLYRTVLAIIYLFAKDMSKKGSRSSPVTNINAAISRFCANTTIEPKKLLKVGFRIRGLTRREILKLQGKHQTYLRTLPNKDEVPAISSLSSAGHLGVPKTGPGPTVIQYNPDSILSKDMLQTLWGWIPHRYTLKRLVQLYTSDEHGTSLRTLFVKCEHAQQTLLVIKSSDDEIFGAFCSASWYERHEHSKQNVSFFGNGETFVFTLTPEEVKYAWAGLNPNQNSKQLADYFLAGDDTRLIIGSGNGEAIELDGMMDHCRTTHCDTFDNNPLNSSEDFSCRVVEVYGFVD